MSKLKITVGQYNTLFAKAEEGLQTSWNDLSLSDKEINDRCNQNEELKEPDYCLGPVYGLYKKNANYIVDKILEELGIEVIEND